MILLILKNISDNLQQLIFKILIFSLLYIVRNASFTCKWKLVVMNEIKNNEWFNWKLSYSSYLNKMNV